MDRSVHERSESLQKMTAKRSVDGKSVGWATKARERGNLFNLDSQQQEEKKHAFIWHTNTLTVEALEANEKCSSKHKRANMIIIVVAVVVAHSASSWLDLSGRVDARVHI